jgi:phage FluMu protein Com
MPIEFRCSQCNALLKTPDDTAGRTAVCPKCGADLAVPTPERPLQYIKSVPLEEPGPRRFSPGENKAIASLVLGLSGLCFFCCCPIGLPCALVGLVLGVHGVRSELRRLAIVGIVLCSLALALNLGYLAYVLVQWLNAGI